MGYDRRAFAAGLASLVLCPSSSGVAYGQQLERSSLKLGVANNNVVDFECASVDVAQHQVGRASRVDRGDARDGQPKPTVPINAAPVSWLLAMS